MKSKKTIESFVGKIIYGFLLFMPLLSILTKSLYVVINDNAKDSYSGLETELKKVNYQTNELNTIDDFVVGNLYYLKWNVITNTSNNIVLDICRFDSLNFLYFDYVNTDVPLNSIIRIRSSVASVDSSVILFTYNSINYYYFGTYLIFDNNTIVFPYIYVQNATSNLLEYSVAVPQEDLQNYYYYEEVQVQELDNVFEYAINQVEQNRLYSWTQDTAVYNVINEMTTAIQVNNSFVDLLLTYWFLITIIYILFDIAFVMLMYVHDKIHGLLEK